MNVDILFRNFKANWEGIKNQTEKSIEIYLNSLIDRVNINNSHYIQSLPNFYFYNLVKEKVKIFLNEIGFECKRCLENCCYFPKRYEEFGILIFKEDYEILKNTQGDLNGYVTNKDLYNNIKKKSLKSNFFNLLQENFDFGYLNVIEKEKIFQCYYFDEKNLSCKIYKYRPLVCYAFPFRFIKKVNDLDIVIDLSCAFIKKRQEKYTADRFIKNILKFSSYWEVWLATSLFFKFIDRYGRERIIK